MMTTRSLQVLLLAAIVAAAGCKRTPSPTVFVDPALASLVPPDVTLLAGARMEQLMETPFWREYILGGGLPGLKEFRKRTGLDPAKNFWELLAMRDGSGTVWLIRGKFSDMGLEPKLDREGAERRSYQGFTMIGDDASAVLFLNPTTAAAGSAAALRRLVDRRHEISGLPQPVAERLGRISSANQVWFIARGDALEGRASLLRPAQYVSGGLDLRNGVKLSATVEARSASEIDALEKSIRQALQPAWRSVSLDRNQAALQVRAEADYRALVPLIR